MTAYQPYNISGIGPDYWAYKVDGQIISRETYTNFFDLGFTQTATDDPGTGGGTMVHEKGYTFTATKTTADFVMYSETEGIPEADEDERFAITNPQISPAPPLVSIKVADEPGAGEAWELPRGINQDGSLKFTVTRVGFESDWIEPLTVKLHPAAGTAISGHDYNGYQNTVVIPAGAGRADLTLTAEENSTAHALMDVALCIEADQNYRLDVFKAVATIHPPINLSLKMIDSGDSANNYASTDPDPTQHVLYVPVAYNDDKVNGQAVPFKVGEFSFTFSGSLDPALDQSHLLWKILDPSGGAAVFVGSQTSKEGAFNLTEAIERHFLFSNPTVCSSIKIISGYDDVGYNALDSNVVLAGGSVQFFDYLISEVANFSGVDPGTAVVRRSPAMLVLPESRTEFYISVFPQSVATNIALSMSPSPYGDITVSSLQASVTPKGPGYKGAVSRTGANEHPGFRLPVRFEIKDPKSNKYKQGRSVGPKIVPKAKEKALNVRVRVVNLGNEHLENDVPSEADLKKLVGDIFGKQSTRAFNIFDYKVDSFNYDLGVANGIFDAGDATEFATMKQKLHPQGSVPGEIYLVFVNRYSAQTAVDVGAPGELVLKRYAFVDVSGAKATHGGTGASGVKIGTIAAHELYHTYRPHNNTLQTGLTWPQPGLVGEYETQFLPQEDW
jgi:hypothetical protein